MTPTTMSHGERGITSIEKRYPHILVTMRTAHSNAPLMSGFISRYLSRSFRPTLLTQKLMVRLR